MNVDWNTYAETFPTRYLNLGPFDEAVDAELAKRQNPIVLEIGGGTTGCPPLQKMEPKPVVWFLDPFVTKLPDWVQGNRGWASVKAVVNSGRSQFLAAPYDVIIARGCINYLTDEQIQLIPRMLSPGGVFLANTFEHRPMDGARRVVNRSGRAFTEVTSWEHPDRIRHQLIPEDGGEPIEHTFRYIQRGMFHRLLGAGCQFERYGTNSLLITVRKP